MRNTWVLIILFCISAKTHAQNTFIKGIVTDEQNRSVPFASVWLGDSGNGAVSNESGNFKIVLKPGNHIITFRSPGYEPLVKTLLVGSDSDVYRMHPISRMASKQPVISTDSLIGQVIAKRKIFRARVPAYAGYIYLKAQQQLDGAPRIFLKKDIAKQLNLNPDRQGIISLSESIARFHTRSTDYIKEQVDAAKFTSNNEAFNFNSAAELHIDLYKDYIFFTGLSDHGFLSPIAENAPHFYIYKLIGQFYDQEKLIDEISIQPKHKDEHLFNGTICVINKDLILYSADLQLSSQNHIDFIDSVHIKQQFVPVSDGTWVPQDMNFRFFGRLLGFKYSGYFVQAYQNVAQDTTSNRGSYKEVFHSSKETYQKDDLFWGEHRAMPLLPQEIRFYQLTALAEKHKKDKTVADSLQNTNNRFRLLNYVINGYTLHHYSNKSSWTFPAPYNLVFFNTVEGYGVDLKVKYTQVYDNQRTLNIIPEARYGFSDHIFNSNVFVNFIYNPYHQASVYGRVGSDFLDLNNTGTIHPFINSLSTLLLGYNYIKLYQSRFIMGGTDGEVANGILLNGQVEYAQRRSLFNTTQIFNKDSVNLTSNNPLDPYGNAQLFPTYKAFIFRGSATFTFDQQYKITPAGKFIMPNPYPRVRLNYREGLPALGSNVDYNFISVDVFQDKLNMGIYGYSSYFISAGTFPNRHNLYFPDYNQFSGGESFFFNASMGSFHFLNFYTYSTYKSYFEAHVEHNFAGFFLSHVPLFNKIHLQEIVGGSYLTQGTLPSYQEVYIGVKRTVIRLDYGLAFGRFSNRIQGFRLSYNL
jgi:hypothetical protein